MALLSPKLKAKESEKAKDWWWQDAQEMVLFLKVEHHKEFCGQDQFFLTWKNYQDEY